MNKLNNKDKKLWDICTNNTHAQAPSKDEVWMRLEQQIDILEQTASNNKPLVRPPVINWQPKFIYAFLLAFLLLMPTTIRYLNTKKIVSEFGITDKNIILSDGTNIQLNAGSALSYSKDYNIKNREVFLKGEAYFDVPKSQFPFIVSTDYAQVTVLGTKFNVRSRSDGFETGVNEGSVEVKNDNESKVLEKGQRALIHPKTNSTIESSPTNKFYPGWLNNKIVCDNTSLETICKEIERTYNIKILFKDNSQKNILISGIINLYPNNLKSVVSSISLLAQREFKLEGDTYIVL